MRKVRIKKALGPDDILHVLCTEVNVTKEELLGAARNSHLVKARKVLCWLLHDRLSWSSVSIATFLQRDHTTVLHHLKDTPDADLLSRCDEVLSNDSVRELVTVFPLGDKIVVFYSDGTLWAGDPTENPKWFPIPLPG